MKKIASFTINHDSLTRGMYVSRVDGDVVTYDIRMKTPNNPENDYLEDTLCIHSNICLQLMFGIPLIQMKLSMLDQWVAGQDFIS